MNFLKQYKIVRETVAKYCADVLGGADPNKRAWLTMVYGCGGCGWEHTVYCLVGVEGPPPLKKNNHTIPSPFFCGKCPQCGESLSHVRWNEDMEIDPPGNDIPIGVAFFSIPNKRQAKKYAKHGYGGAEYTDPTGVTR